VPSKSSGRPTAEARLIEDWARLGNPDEGNPDEFRRICKAILDRPGQGYPVACEAQRIIAAHVDYWRDDIPVERAGGHKHRDLLEKGHVSTPGGRHRSPLGRV
jgi:hypothetical protein